MRGIGRHLASQPMIRNLDHAVTIERETIKAGCRNIGTENGKTFWSEKVRLRRFQVKYRLSAGAEEITRKWQQIRRPRSRRHHDRISRQFFATFQYDPFHAAGRFV